MSLSHAAYSRKALCTCAERIKATNWTVRRKADHFPKCFEVKAVFVYCLDKTNCCLFEPEYTVWRDYLKAVGLKGITKKELDTLLHRCHLYLCNEVNSIAALIETSEVDVLE